MSQTVFSGAGKDINIRLTATDVYPNLKLQLWRRGIRQNQLAKVLHIDETVLSRIMNGFREPSPLIRGRIATLLHCDEAWLFESVRLNLKIDSHQEAGDKKIGVQMPGE